jgi:hypothetical protein
VIRRPAVRVESGINVEAIMKAIVLAVIAATLAGCAIVPIGPPAYGRPHYERPYYEVPYYEPAYRR